MPVALPVPAPTPECQCFITLCLCNIMLKNIMLEAKPKLKGDGLNIRIRDVLLETTTAPKLKEIWLKCKRCGLPAPYLKTSYHFKA